MHPLRNELYHDTIIGLEIIAHRKVIKGKLSIMACGLNVILRIRGAGLFSFIE
jgi:hypothetical protein